MKFLGLISGEHTSVLELLCATILEISEVEAWREPG